MWKLCLILTINHLYHIFKEYLENRDFGVMSSQTGSNITDLKTRLPVDLSKRFLIANGAPVLQKKFQQAANTASDLLSLAKKSEFDFLKEMESIRRELGLSRIIYPGLKTEKRIDEKAIAEKGGDVSKIFDPLRIAFVAQTPSKIKNAVDFFTPARNTHVLSLADQFARPDAESGMRRVKIVYQMPTILTEIQIWHPQMLGAFETTHKPFEKQRGIFATLMTSASKLSYGACGRLQREEKALSELRKSIHNTAAEKAGLNALVEHRTFGQIGPIPFVAIKRPIDAFPTILRPDPCSGTYMQDNALATAYFEGKFIPTCRNEFIIASHRLVNNHAIETQPRAIRNTRNLDRA